MRPKRKPWFWKLHYHAARLMITASKGPEAGMTIILITGGARWGKSVRAESPARSFPGQPVYIATAEALDAEVSERITRHRARRGSECMERDAPPALVGALDATAGRGPARAGCA